jgi:GT2 family glycosyltransferase
MSAGTTLAASVVVATYQRRDAVARLLTSLCAQTADPQSFEVIVVADGSTDGTTELVESFAAPYALRGEWQENTGRAAASNRAIALSSAGLLVILDDDMVASPGLIAAHVAAHADGRPRFVMGPAPIQPGRDASPFLRYMATMRNEHYERLAEPGHVFHVRELYSGNASVPRAVMQRVGGFDEQYRTYGGEDVDLALRLRAAGVELSFAPDALASEGYEKHFTDLADDMVQEGRNAVTLALAHPQAASGQQFAEPWPQAWWWKAARRTLLALTRVVPATRRAVVGLTAALDRHGARHMHLWLRFVLEYHYWIGAGPELRRARREGRPLT